MKGGYGEGKMKLFLCSNFKYLAKKFLPEFFDLSKKHTALLVGYADEEGDFYSESNAWFLRDLNFDVIHLDENYKFNDNIDMIYVKGGNTTQLVYLLRKFNQYEEIVKLVKSGSVYVGQSAGSVIAGTDTEWTLRSEPYDVAVKDELGNDALKGFGFVNGLVFVHASRYRFPFSDEIEKAGRCDFRVKNKLFYADYLKDRKDYRNENLIILKDNESLIKNGENERIVKYDWSDYPVLDKYRIY